MGFFMFVIITLIIYFALNQIPFIKESNKAPEVNKKRLDEIISKSGAKGEKFILPNCLSAAILDKEKEKVYIYSVKERDLNNQCSYKYHSFDFSDIIEAETIINNTTVTKTSRGSQIAGTAIGGALLGGVGVVIGGLSGTKVGDENILEAKIKLTIDNISKPVHNIIFLNNESKNYTKFKNGYKKGSYQYNQLIPQLEKWQGMFDVILKNNN